jgi:hypothetical protein
VTDGTWPLLLLVGWLLGWSMHQAFDAAWACWVAPRLRQWLSGHISR